MRSTSCFSSSGSWRAPRRRRSPSRRGPTGRIADCSAEVSAARSSCDGLGQCGRRVRRRRAAGIWRQRRADAGQNDRQHNRVDFGRPELLAFQGEGGVFGGLRRLSLVLSVAQRSQLSGLLPEPRRKRGWHVRADEQNAVDCRCEHLVPAALLPRGLSGHGRSDRGCPCDDGPVDSGVRPSGASAAGAGRTDPVLGVRS